MNKCNQRGVGAWSMIFNKITEHGSHLVKHLCISLGRKEVEFGFHANESSVSIGNVSFRLYDPTASQKPANYSSFVLLGLK